MIPRQADAAKIRALAAETAGIARSVQGIIPDLQKIQVELLSELQFAPHGGPADQLLLAIAKSLCPLWALNEIIAAAESLRSFGLDPSVVNRSPSTPNTEVPHERPTPGR